MEQKKKNKAPRKIRLYKSQSGAMDYSILLVVTGLCAFGLVMVFSASYYYALHNAGCNYDGYYYLKRQGAYMAIAYPLMLVISKINYRYIKRLSMLALAFSIVLLIAVLLFGKELNGGKRWLDIAGISIQPSEVAKFGLIIYMCAYMADHRSEMRSFTRGLVPMLIVIGVVCFFIFLQPNMSMAVIVAAIGAILLFLGGIDLKYFGILAIVGVILFVVLAMAAPYRLARITSFRDPFADPKGSGYQLIQSLYAIGSAGWFGKGLGNSYQKLLYMTYGESDFIFAILCEEFGIVGGIVIILAYAFIVFRGMRCAMLCSNPFGSLLAAGISIVFGMQVFINIAVVTGLAPTTGQPLPFISAGGTSLIIFMAAMGVLLNITRETSNLA